MMPDMTLCAKLRESSKDKIFYSLVTEFLFQCAENKINPLIIGSCATQSYSDYAYRIPGDLDIVIRHDEFNIIRNIQLFEVTQHNGFYEILFKNLKVHVIISIFDLINKENGNTVGTINFDSIKENWLTINELSFRSCCSRRTIRIKVPIVEIVFLLNLLKPINTNTMHDTIYLFNNYHMNNEVMIEFINIHRNIAELFLHRINDLAQMISSTYNLSSQYVSKKLISIFDNIEEKVFSDK